MFAFEESATISGIANPELKMAVLPKGFTYDPKAGHIVQWDGHQYCDGAKVAFGHCPSSRKETSQ
eukprot:15083437-Ditylum_brightwellii.AAC.1